MNDYNWEYLEFKTCVELQRYVDKLKEDLIDEPIKSLSIIPTYTTDGEYIDAYELAKEHDYICTEVDEPAILTIGEHTLIFNMYEGSNLHISLDKSIEIIDKDNPGYYDISKLLSKTVLNKKITDITIKPITLKEAQASINLYPEKYWSNDMFSGIEFTLENNSFFIIATIWDMTGIIAGFNISDYYP